MNKSKLIKITLNKLLLIPRMVKTFWKWYLKTSWKKKIGVTAIALVLLFFLTSPLRSTGPAYKTASATKNTVMDIVSETGNVTSSGRFDVYSTSTGYIEEAYVQNGDYVNAGDYLFKVKSTATPEEKAKTYSDYLAAQNALNSAKAQMNSLKSALFKANQTFLNDRGIDNPSTDQKADPVYIQQESDWLQAEANYKNQTGVINQTQAAFTKASFAYQAAHDMIITAPASGTIANFSASVGDSIVVSSQTSAIPTLVILGQLSTSTIKVSLNEVDVNKIKIGQAATITFDAFREIKYKGYVTSVDTAGTNTNGVITYNATVAIDNPDTNIKTEMTTTVSIETAKSENALTVPNSAIKPYKGGKAVIVKGESKDNQVKNKTGKILPLHYVPVKVGLKGITRTEILEGIKEGTHVVTSSIN